MKDILWIIAAFIAGMSVGASLMHRYMQRTVEGWQKLYDELTEEGEG